MARRHSAAVSLFAGAGGMDIGVEKAGFKTVCAIESDPHCAATLRRNAPRKVVWQADVRVVDPQRLLDVLELQPGEVGLLHGGPPCQPFSQIGKRGGLDDPRGALIFEVLRFAHVVRPLAVLIEQVPNFLRTQVPTGRHLLEELRAAFRSLGYDMHVDVVDAQAHGVAQRRRRALLVCVPAGTPFAFPPPTIKTETVGTALRGLPVPSAPDEAPPVANHIDVTPARDRERIAYVPEGLWLAKAPDVPPDILRNLTRKDTTKYRRLHRRGIAPTLRCGEALYHPLEDRYITPREAARLQGFPDQHVFEGPIRRRTGRVRDLDQHRQVANAVPPPLARAAAAQVREALGHAAA